MALSKEYNEDLRKLLSIAESLWDTDMELIKLESEDKTECLEFQDIINRRRTTLSLEESLYSKISFDEAAELVTYLYALENISEELKAVISPETMEIVKKRVIIKLSNVIDSIKRKSFSSSIDQRYYDIYDIECFVKEDLVNTILTILNLYLNDIRFKNIKDFLLVFKHKMGFIYPFIGEDFMDNNFNINPKLYWKSGALAELKGEKFAHEKFQNNIAIDLVSEILYDVKDLTDLPYDISILYQILARTFFLFSKDEEFKKRIINNWKRILDDSMEKGNAKNNLLIIKAIDYIEADKELVSIISFQR